MKRRFRWRVTLGFVFVGIWMTAAACEDSSPQDPGDGGVQSDAVTDPDAGDLCGNGVVDDGETCDTNCPASIADCPAPDACEAVTFTGSACTAQCGVTPIESCEDGDGCCPAACDYSSDDDCPDPSLCGNDALDPGETCDSDCPESIADCQSPAACETVSYTGSAATCTALCDTDPITACLNGDGCCPAGCDSGTDDDCANVCGDGQVVGDETCDPPSTCPTQPADCGPLQDCDVATITGDPAQCTAECVITTTSTFVQGDGCCPGSGEFFQDDDCPVSSQAATLCTLINDYRVANGLPAIPVSKSLTAVAEAHTWDHQFNNPDSGAGCNLHSWSSSPPADVSWSGCCYTSDHAQAACMWNKPGEITAGWASSYNSNGYEISVGGTSTPSNCLSSWQGSSAHNDVILNQGMWTSHPWAAVGCSARWNTCHVWFGELTDPNPFP